MEEQQIQEITQNVYNIKEIIEGQIPSLALFALRVLISLIIFFVGMRVTGWVLGHLRKPWSVPVWTGGSFSFSVRF